MALVYSARFNRCGTGRPGFGDAAAIATTVMRLAVARLALVMARLPAVSIRATEVTKELRRTGMCVQHRHDNGPVGDAQRRFTGLVPGVDLGALLREKPHH